MKSSCMLKIERRRKTSDKCSLPKSCHTQFEKQFCSKYTVRSIDTAKCQHCYSYKLGNQTIESEFISTDSPALSHTRNIFLITLEVFRLEIHQSANRKGQGQGGESKSVVCTSNIRTEGCEILDLSYVKFPPTFLP